MEKISVIGGSGFIGSAFCRLLARQGLPFEIVDLRISRRFPDRCRLADIRDPAALDGAVTGRVLVHLAAVHRDDVADPAEYFATNVTGTRNLCDLALRRGIGQIVFTSSVAVHGAAAGPVGPATPVVPATAYGASKALAEAVLTGWRAQAGGGASLAVLRPTAVFGEGGGGNVATLFRQIAARRFVMVGAGENRKSLAYVGNVAALLLALTQARPAAGLWSYADGPDLTMAGLVALARARLLGRTGAGPRLPAGAALALGHLADRIAAARGRPLAFSAQRVRKFCAETRCTATPLAGFVPPFTLQEGLERTLAAEAPHRFGLAAGLVPAG